MLEFKSYFLLLSLEGFRGTLGVNLTVLSDTWGDWCIFLDFLNHLYGFYQIIIYIKVEKMQSQRSIAILIILNFLLQV